MIYKSISEIMDGLEIDLDTLQLNDSESLASNAIKAMVMQRIRGLEGSDQCDPPASLCTDRFIKAQRLK